MKYIIKVTEGILISSSLYEPVVNSSFNHWRRGNPAWLVIVFCAIKLYFLLDNICSAMNENVTTGI